MSYDSISSVMTGLKLRVLVDNTTLTDRYFVGEPALSLYLECSGKRILFDTGYSGVFLANAGKMGIDLLGLDFVVLLHGHIDHTGGLTTLLRMYMEAATEGRKFTPPMVIAHPHCFYPRSMPQVVDTGAPVDEATVLRQCPVTTSRKPLWLTKDLVFLGEIERISDVIPDRGKKRTIITPEGAQPDRLLDDSALVYLSDQGLVIITGCTHAGVGNLIAYARKVCAEQKIRDIVGGLHLKESDRDTLDATLRILEDVRPTALHPCHCTSLAAKVALCGIAQVGEAGTGLTLEY